MNEHKFRNMFKEKKVLFVCGFLCVLWYIICFQRTVVMLDSMLGTLNVKQFTSKPNKSIINMKYILQWTKSYTQPFNCMDVGQKTFIRRKCSVNNCFVTSNRSLLGKSTNFDAVLFHGPEICTSIIRRPRRSLKQKFVFVSRESSNIYPIYYLQVYQSFFNWTWTYRLDSDIYYGYITIRNKSNDIIGPKQVMHWPKIEEMKPIDKKIKEKLKHKTTAAAWFVSHCKTNSKRHVVAELLQKQLSVYNLSIHIYGMCGNKYFPQSYMKNSLAYLQYKYYFYLAFENSITEDYVTEKLLHALQHYTVPIVYGGANYTRFMPDGSYLVASMDNAKELAKQMYEIINDRQKYYDFFRWTNHFSYHYPEESAESDFYCDLCNKLHDDNLMKQTSIHESFWQWWNLR